MEIMINDPLEILVKDSPLYNAKQQLENAGFFIISKEENQASNSLGQFQRAQAPLCERCGYRAYK